MSVPRIDVGFFVTFSTIVLVVWVLAVGIADRRLYWEFQPGQIIEFNELSGGQTGYSPQGVIVTQLPVDFMTNYILGLGWLGLGTSDIKITLTTGRIAIIENVWRGRKRVAEINTLIRVVKVQ